MTVRRLIRGFALLALVAVAANATALVVPASADYGAVRMAWIAAGLAALAGTVAAARRVAGSRVQTAWILWSAAAAVWLVGSVVGAVASSAGGSTRLAPDAFWSVALLLAIGGLAYRSAPGPLSFHVFLLDALPIVLGLVGVALLTGNLPETTPMLAFATGFSAVAALLPLVALQLLIWMTVRETYMWILVAGFVVIGTAGLTLPVETGASGAAAGHWSSALWTLGVLLVALAGIRRTLAPAHETRQSPIDREHAARSLPAAAAIVGLIVVTGLASERSEPILWLAIAAAAIFAVRTYLVRRANNAAQRELARLVHADPLTGLLNRRGLQEALSREAGSTLRTGVPLHVLLLDLDDFKAINDTLGHAVGDVALQEVANALRSSTRSTDHAARIGGDEFLVLLPEVGVVEAGRAAERIRVAVSNLMFSSHQHVARVTVSVGLATVEPGANSIDELLVQAHRVLRHAKDGGKNRVSSRATRPGAPRSTELVAEALLAGDVLRGVRQPIVRLGDRSVAGHELLVRSTIAGYELPSDFFPLCAQANVLTLVDYRCVLACLEMADWSTAELRYHVNVFPSTLLDLPPDQLVAAFPDRQARTASCIEISEQQILGDPSYLVPVVQALKQEGLSFAIDDVGFGRSSLESLILLEPEVVKIDRQCIAGVSESFGRLRSLKRLLRVAEALGAEVVAEGIETERDLRVLANLGVPYGQGYLFGRPSESEQVLRIAAFARAAAR